MVLFTGGMKEFFNISFQSTFPCSYSSRVDVPRRMVYDVLCCAAYLFVIINKRILAGAEARQDCLYREILIP